MIIHDNVSTEKILTAYKRDQMDDLLKGQTSRINKIRSIHEALIGRDEKEMMK